MKSALRILLSCAAAFAVAASVNAQVPFTSWEAGIAGWTDQSAGNYTYSSSSTLGVTEGTKSLACTAAKAPGWSNLISFGDVSVHTALTDVTKVKLDVLAVGTTGTTLANVTIAFNGNGGSWAQSASKDVVLGTETTVTWDLTPEQIALVKNSNSWFQFWIIAQTDGGAGSVFYLDNLLLISPDTPPILSTQPANQVATVGATATFTVAATGPHLAYQWYFNNFPISGYNSPTLTIPCVQTTDAGVYSCNVHNGGGAVASDDVTLTVNPTVSTTTATVSINATSVVQTVDDRMFGINTAIWDGAFKGPATLPLLAAIDMRAMRFPGGSASDEYHWNSTDAASASLTFDQFAETALALKSHAYITVNYGTGTVQEAADWVTYSNVTKKYGFKYWEIGNENYGSWEADTHAAKWDPVTYANAVKDFALAMKAVDPTIKIGIAVQVGEDVLDSKSPVHNVTNPRTGVSHHGWTPVVLATLKSIGYTPDFLDYHRYEQGPFGETDAGLLQSAKTWPNDAANLRQMLTDYLGSAGASVELDVTENNSVYTTPGKQGTSLVNALYYADSLGNLLQTEFKSMLWWDLRNGKGTTYNNSASLYGWRDYGDYGIMSDANDLYPNYYEMKLLTRFARGGDSIVTTTSNNTLLSAFAAKRADGTLSVLVVNKSPTATTNVTFGITGYTPAPIAPVYAYGVSQDRAAQTGVGLKDVTVSSLSGVASNFTASFLPYSTTVLTLYPNTGSSRLVNLSLRAIAGTDSQVLIPGFFAGGDGTVGSLPVVIRADGPSLGLFGVEGYLPDSQITLHQSIANVDYVMGANDNWGGSSELAQLFSDVGAFPFPTDSLDAALSVSLAGLYTAVVSDTQARSGVALAEVYDAAVNPDATTPRLLNISGRAQVSPDPNVMIAGFVIRGSSPKTVLIRAAGPTLGTTFGIPGSLARPHLDLHTYQYNPVTGNNDIDTVIATNTAWGGTTALKNVFAQVHAFGFANDTTDDAALLVTLPPGSYTAIVSGENDTSGVALVEVYDVQ